MSEHDVTKALEVWTLQTLLNISILLGVLALGFALVQGYYRSLEKHPHGRVDLGILVGHPANQDGERTIAYGVGVDTRPTELPRLRHLCRCLPARCHCHDKGDGLDTSGCYRPPAQNPKAVHLVPKSRERLLRRRAGRRIPHPAAR